MQRFRTMRLYSSGLVLLLVTVIGAVAWLRQPAPAEAQATATSDPIGAEATPADRQPTSSPADSRDETKIAIDNFSFKPKELTISAGTTVTWVNHDDVPHTATSAAMPRAFDSKALDTDDKFAFKFTKPGTYKYYCKIHTHMTGTVIVK